MLTFLPKLIRSNATLLLGALTVVALCPAVTSGSGDSLLLAAISSVSSGPGSIPEGRYLYKFDWNGIPSAETEVIVSKEERGEGPLYCFEGTARTSKLVDVFWRLRARVVAVVDALSGRTLKIDVDNQENQRRKKTETVFNYGSAEAYYTRWKKEKVQRKTIQLQGNIIDPASLALMICQQPLKEGDTGAFTVLFEDDAYALEYTVTAQEKISVAGNEFNTFRIEPRFHKISDRPNDKPPKVKAVTLWVTDTQPRIPLRMRSRTFIGYVNGELVMIVPKGSEKPS